MTKLKKPDITQLINLDTFTKGSIEYCIDHANYFLENAINKKAIIPNLQGKVVTALFFEPSTRTLNSFVLAAERLGALVLAPHLATSATVKGESLIDTVQTFEAMGTDAFIIRHSDNHTPEFIRSELKTNATILNAGDGTNRHPTQALLDAMTISQQIDDFSKISVAIVGDIDHSRVANSLIIVLSKLGVPDIRLVGPESLVSKQLVSHNTSVVHNLADGVKDADIVITLRIQKERFSKKEQLDEKKYREQFCVTSDILAKAKQSVLVMHPGPMNRNLEISSEVADSSQALILNQVTNGVAMRMALLDILMNRR